MFLVLLCSAYGPLPHSSLPSILFWCSLSLSPCGHHCFSEGPPYHLFLFLFPYSPFPPPLSLSKNWDHHVKMYTMATACQCLLKTLTFLPSTLFLLSGIPISLWGALHMTMTGTEMNEGDTQQPAPEALSWNSGYFNFKSTVEHGDEISR